MFAKLLFAMVVAGAVACALLVNRQQRIDTAHEMSLVHGRLLLHQRTLWELQGEIARRCRPAEVRDAMAGLDCAWVAMPRDQRHGVRRPRPIPAMHVSLEGDAAAALHARRGG
jgi:hypothetical protein